ARLIAHSPLFLPISFADLVWLLLITLVHVPWIMFHVKHLLGSLQAVAKAAKSSQHKAGFCQHDEPILLVLMKNGPLISDKLLQFQLDLNPRAANFQSTQFPSSDHR